MGDFLADAQRLVAALEDVSVRSAALEEGEVTAGQTRTADEARWAARLAGAEAAAAHAVKRSLDLERERERLVKELELATKRHGSGREELSRALEAARTAERARAVATAEMEGLRATLTSARSALAAAREETRRAQAESQRVEATAYLARTQAEQLRVELAAVRTGERTTSGATARTTAEFQDARRHAQVVERARTTATEADVERLRAALASAEAAARTAQ